MKSFHTVKKYFFPFLSMLALFDVCPSFSKNHANFSPEGSVSNNKARTHIRLRAGDFLGNKLPVYDPFEEKQLRSKEGILLTQRDYINPSYEKSAQSKSLSAPSELKRLEDAIKSKQKPVLEKYKISDSDLMQVIGLSDEELKKLSINLIKRLRAEKALRTWEGHKDKTIFYNDQITNLKAEEDTLNKRIFQIDLFLELLGEKIKNPKLHIKGVKIGHLSSLIHKYTDEREAILIRKEEIEEEESYMRAKMVNLDAAEQQLNRLEKNIRVLSESIAAQLYPLSHRPVVMWRKKAIGIINQELISNF